MNFIELRIFLNFIIYNFLPMKFFSIHFILISFSSLFAFESVNYVKSDISKTILVYSINNKTNEIIAKIEAKAIVRDNKFINAYAKLLDNKLDKITVVKKLELKIENDIILLSVLIEDDVGCTLFLGLNKDGNVRSLSPNMGSDESDLRFGGVFLEQGKGIFKTESITLK